MKFAIVALAAILMVLAIFFVLRSDIALLTHPKGIIAKKEIALIGKTYLHMLIIVVPTIILLFAVAWRYHSKNAKAEYDPELTGGIWGELILWALPSLLITGMAFVTWNAAHELDPYKPIESGNAPLTIQVVALDWKWLFIYPEQGIATVNFVQFPAETPIHFELSADGSPMNSFWIPELSGQIYSMAGMTTVIHMMADGPGVYPGRAAEINGEGFADMTFTAKSAWQSDFEEWVALVKRSPLKLTEPVYNELVKPSLNHPIQYYSDVDSGLFNKIVMKYMHPGH